MAEENGTLELELEESFMSPIHDAIPKPPEASTSIEPFRLEDSRFDSIDEIMEEVEDNHHQESLLEIDSEFGGDGEVEESFMSTICKSENLVADLNNLNYLVKLASVKHSGSSIQNVLSNLFRIPIKESVNSKDPSGSKQVYLNDLVRDISICGQNERIIQGCFESYLTS
ncbi:hypothetical protein KEM48_001710 [Puccinia striiformis f. sp. tritici PST-130]|nr:hypothetical protein H4Q26_002263 [Puccinia striiformis f. sp. tritici PST-130]KAI9606941.1 hypothetical protein KEM48_001710 [Puccinia striiformis f. sp. tritici PST-130]